MVVYQCIDHNEDSLGVMQTLHNLSGVIILFSMKVYIDILRPYEMRADKFRGRKRVSLPTERKMSGASGDYKITQRSRSSQSVR